jgi:ABC-type transport system involved in multi-copper enzyme maturation permease subunit
MVLIELKKIIKDSLVIVLLLLALVMGLLFTDKDVYLAPALEIFLIFFASFIGWSMFERERQEGAMEYMLSLPSSRLKLFFSKFFPRLTVISVTLVVYELIYQQFSVHFLWPDYRFVFLFLTVFLLSVSLSLSMKSFLSTFFITLFLSLGLYFLIRYLDFSKMDTAIAIQAGLSFLIFPILFILFFHRYDIRPVSHFNRKYIPALIVFLLILFGLTYITSNVKWWHCYLTKNGSLFSVSRNTTFIQNKKGEGKTIRFSVSPLFENNGAVLASLFSNTENSEQLVRLNPYSGEIEKRYLIPRGYWFHDFIDIRSVIEKRAYFLLTRLGHRNYQIMEVAGDQTRFIPIKKDFGNEIFHMISGVANNPLQFFILTFDRKNSAIGKNVYRVFEDGRVEDLFPAIAISTWDNRILRFTGEGMILYEMGKSAKEIFRMNGHIKRLRRKFENFIQKKVLIKTDGDLYIFDLTDLSLEKMNLKKMPYYYYLTNQDELRLIWTDGPEISVSVWKNRHMQVENVWFTKINGLKIIRVFQAGVVIYNQKEHQVFSFHKNGGGEDKQQNHHL